MTDELNTDITVDEALSIADLASEIGFAYLSRAGTATVVLADEVRRLRQVEAESAHERAALLEKVIELNAAIDRLAALQVQPQEWRQATPAEEAATDEALGLVLLPPIRVSQVVFDRIGLTAQAEGVILQAIVRDVLADRFDPANDVTLKSLMEPRPVDGALTDDQVRETADANRYRLLREHFDVIEFRRKDRCLRIENGDCPTKLDLVVDGLARTFGWVASGSGSAT